MDLTAKYADKVDELFKDETKLPLLTNTDYDWTGAHSIIIWKINTAVMNDYARNVQRGRVRYSTEVIEGSFEAMTRYGDLYDLEAQTEELLLRRDRSFIFNIDKLDREETKIQAETSLARQLRNVVVPEVDTYVYNEIVKGAGKVATPAALTEDNVYSAILEGSEYMDDKEVLDTERVIVVTPATYKLLKKAKEFDSTDVGADLKTRGVVAEIDGMSVIKVPASRLPKNFGFMIVHPSATTAPLRLEDYHVHNDTPLSSGTIVTGRICYDAFVLDNRKDGIYYHPIAADSTGTTE